MPADGKIAAAEIGTSARPFGSSQTNSMPVQTRYNTGQFFGRGVGRARPTPSFKTVECRQPVPTRQRSKKLPKKFRMKSCITNSFFDRQIPTHAKMQKPALGS